MSYRQIREIATRKALQNTLNAYGPMLPEAARRFSGSGSSNLTIWKVLFR
ncbi:hypothetical protein ACLB1Q_31505 [Escherichia coli]